MTVSCVIAAFNEADRVGETVRAVLGIPAVDEVVVADDGSEDATRRCAEDAGARVISCPHRGKGEALQDGIAAATGDVILLLDADLGVSGALAQSLLEPVLDGQVDLAIATFPRTAHKGGFGWAVGLARWGIRCLTGREMEAPLSGQRAFRREVLEGRGVGRGWEVEVGLTVDALRGGFRVKEIPLPMAHRATGRSARDFAHRAKQLMGVARALWQRW